MNIIISRTDSIGDVILTIPITGYLKYKFPDCKIYFLGRSYTKAIIQSSANIDEFLNWDEIAELSEKDQLAFFNSLHADWFFHIYPNKAIAKLAKKALIKNRVGTSHRTYHWLNCNKLLNFTRKKSDLHEAQLNFKLLTPLGINFIPDLSEIEQYYGISVLSNNKPDLPIAIHNDKKNIILHPKSKGSAREWGLDNFGKLIDLLPTEQYRIFISGTADDKNKMKDWLKKYEGKIEDITGKLSLDQFIQFIAKADALVAASTGPLHIAAALGIKTIGIYPPIKPMHPGRWRPIGKNAHVLVLDKECNDCRKASECACMKAIKPEDVVRLLEE
jgi:heptosyltransferase III